MAVYPLINSIIWASMLEMQRGEDAIAQQGHVHI
jgi:hypothetical protein